jgi:hypothetical protein
MGSLSRSGGGGHAELVGKTDQLRPLITKVCDRGGRPSIVCYFTVQEFVEDRELGCCVFETFLIGGNKTDLDIL